ncbi:MAG: MFS transporter [Flavobacterium sp. BFFFF1]|uniref:MFS transporter n=1 Tax=Flavobacterium sp. BFFFF1 TaxID=2015557 RepID=UPI000BCB4A2A|nr:MFS transporter [Flavobacterium sp. BFFFF1]OYU79209.1 MAG: MFS transporter [Flavobacterium sp. BFFFF1]
MQTETPTPIPRKGFISKNPSLKIREFRSYLTLRLGVIFALNMQSTTIYFWVYQMTNDKLSLGFVGLAEVIPAICCSFFSGHFVDLNEKRKMITICLAGYIITGICLLLLAVPMTAQHLGASWMLHLIYFFVFLGGALRSFYSPSMFSLFGLVVPRADYPNATGWSSMAWQVGSVLGPLAAGFAIASLCILSSLSIVVALEFLLLVPLFSIAAKPIIRKEKERVMKSVTEGLRFVWNTPVLLSALTLDMFSVLFGGAVALLPVYQKEILHVNEMGFGLLRAAPGIGAIITLGLLALIPLKKQPGRKLFICVAGFAISIIVFGISTNFILSFCMLLFSGMFDAVSVVIRGTILQLVTPDHMRGRVSAVNTMFVSSSNELGDFESGVMAHFFGAVRAVVIGGCLTLGVVGYTLFSAPQLRKFTFDEKKQEHE